MRTYTPDEKSNTKLLILGRSASGKDTLRRELEKRGFTFVKSYTDRPRRTPDEDTHEFVTTDEAKHILDTETIIAKTEIDGNLYFATEEQFNNANAYILDPVGLDELAQNMPDTTFHMVYVEADPDKREQIALNRIKTDKDARQKIASREASEDAMFSEFEEKLDRFAGGALPDNIRTCNIFENDYTRASLEEKADNIACEMSVQHNIERLIRFAVSQEILDNGATPHTIRVVLASKAVVSMSIEEFACQIMSSEEDTIQFMLHVLALTDLPDLQQITRDSRFNAQLITHWEDADDTETRCVIDTETMSIVETQENLPQNAKLKDAFAVLDNGTYYTVASRTAIETSASDKDADEIEIGDDYGNGIIWMD